MKADRSALGDARKGRATAWRPLTIWTVGHSTRSIEEFIEMLRAEQINTLADVRRVPGSRRVPQFNADVLQVALGAAQIRYEPLFDLGGRRRPRLDSHNTIWRNASFRGYADYMETPAFREGIERLLKLARAGRTAIMCAEAVWWRCHRSMIADYLKSKKVQVLHIMALGKIQEHPYTSPAHLKGGRLTYAY